MKKIMVTIISIICIGTFVGMLIFLDFKEKPMEKPTEYLIDILIENKEKINVDYINMGIISSNDKEEIINTVKGENANKDTIHFTINYAPDTQFFLKGMSGKKEIETCFFDVINYSKFNEPQEIHFYIEDYKIHKE